MAQPHIKAGFMAINHTAKRMIYIFEFCLRPVENLLETHLHRTTGINKSL
jgi:hypothetical protein